MANPIMHTIATLLKAGCDVFFRKKGNKVVFERAWLHNKQYSRYCYKQYTVYAAVELACPKAADLMADWGADVTWLENTGAGDTIRDTAYIK